MKISIFVGDVWKFNQLIANYIKKQKHEVTFVDSSTINFTYKNNKQRFKNFFSKTFLKKNIKTNFRNNELVKIINNLPYQDYILIINPDDFSQEVVDLLRTKTTKYVAHNYDCLARHTLPKNYAELFDKIFSFDIQDVKDYHYLNLLNNYIYVEENPDTNPKNKMFMILSKSLEREKVLNKIANILDKKNIHNYEFIVAYPDVTDVNKNIKLINYTISLEELAEKVKNAEILIDLVRPNQSGLSFRFFEAMAFHKKIITNNKNVKLFGFYNPNNILVIDNDITDIDNDFLNNTYQPVPENIYKKYTIETWVNTILDV